MIDEHGDALAWDLQGRVDFWAVITDLLSDEPRHQPGYLLALMEWLPDDGAFAASLSELPPSRGRAPDPGRRRWYGWGQDRHMRADLWDLTSAAHTAAKKKPARYPRPSVKQQRGQSILSLMPKPGAGTRDVIPVEDRPRSRPRVAGEPKT